MAAILKKHFVVVSDPISAQNNTTFGVSTWFYTAERKEVRNYYWGTGNCLIGRVYTEEYHRKRTKELVRLLTEVRQLAAGELRSAETFFASITSVDPEKKVIAVTQQRGYSSSQYGTDWNRTQKDRELKLGAETKITVAMNELKEATPLADGLKSKLLDVSAEVKVLTTTDKNGITRVDEVRVTGRASRK